MNIPTNVAVAVAAHAAFLATMTAGAAQPFLEVEIDGYWCRFTAEEPKGGGALIVRCVGCEAFTNQISQGTPEAGVELKRDGKLDVNFIDAIVIARDSMVSNPNP